jgi:hypothetical protein
LISFFGNTSFYPEKAGFKVVNPSLTAGIDNQPPVFLTSVNADQLKQMSYGKGRTIDFTAGITGNSQGCNW